MKRNIIIAVIALAVIGACIIAGFAIKRNVIESDPGGDAIRGIDKAYNAKFVMETLYEPQTKEYGYWEESRFPPDQIAKRYNREGMRYKKIDDIPENRQKIEWDAYRFYDNTADPKEVDNAGDDDIKPLLTVYDVNETEYVGVSDGESIMWFQRR